MNLVLLALALSVPQDAAPAPREEGVRVRELSFGFLPVTDLPNAPPSSPGQPRRRAIGRTETWMPLTLRLENLGAPVDGRLVVRPVLSGSNRVLYTQRANLGRTLKSFTFPVLHFTAQELEISFEDDAGDVVRLDGARALAVPQPHSVDVTLVLVATRSPNNFSHFLIRSGQGGFSDKRFVIPILPSQLPANAIEYHGIDVVVLDDLPARRLSAEQQDALVEFVARGGVLALGIYDDASRPAGTRLEPLLPGQPGDELVNVTDVSALAAATGVPCPLEAPKAMRPFAPLPGATVWDPALPVALHRPYDRGMVVAFGFSLSERFLETWPGSMRLMDALSDCRERPVVPLPGGTQTLNLRRDMALALKETMIRKLPPFGTILAIMAVYGVLTLAGPYLVFRRLKRLEWSWAAILGFAVVGSAVVYGVGEGYLRKESTAYRVGLVEGGGEPGAHLRHNFWSVFTARGDNLDLSFEEPRAVPFRLGDEISLRGSSRRDDLVIAYAEEARIRGLRTYTQDSALFETTDVETLGGALRAELVGHGASARVRARVDGDLPVIEAWLVQEDRAAPLSGLGSAVKDFELPQGTIEEALGVRQDQPLLDRACRVMLRQASVASAARERRPILVYRYDGSPSLRNRSLAEHGLDFGWVELSGWIHGEARSWATRPLTIPRRGESEDEVQNRPEGMDYALVFAPIPPGCRVKDLQFVRLPGPPRVAELYDFRGRAWVPQTGRRAVQVDRYVHHTPLGPAYAQVRVRAANGAIVANGGGPRSAVEALSSLERKKP